MKFRRRICSYFSHFAVEASRDEIGSEAYANISRALGCAIVVVVFRALRNYLTHALASRLHSSTLWEQVRVGAFPNPGTLFTAPL